MEEVSRKIVKLEKRIDAIRFILQTGGDENDLVQGFREHYTPKELKVLEAEDKESLRQLREEKNILSRTFERKVIDGRYQLFNPDVTTSVKSNDTFKSFVRRHYDKCCLMCGSKEFLTVAHIVSNSNQQTYTEFGPPQYKDQMNPESIKNRIVLCGTLGTRGTCHDHFDQHFIEMYHDPFHKKYMWFCFKSVEVNGVTKHVGESWPVEFPSKLDKMHLPYRRLIAWRFQRSAINYSSNIEMMSWAGTLADLSEKEEMEVRQQSGYGTSSASSKVSDGVSLSELDG